MIEAGQLKLTMETGNSGKISVSSIFIVNDGLQHVALVSFGVGFLQLQVDDDLVQLRTDVNQPGLPQVKLTESCQAGVTCSTISGRKRLPWWGAWK